MEDLVLALGIRRIQAEVVEKVKFYRNSLNAFSIVSKNYEYGTIILYFVQEGMFSRTTKVLNN